MIHRKEYSHCDPACAHIHAMHPFYWSQYSMKHYPPHMWSLSYFLFFFISFLKSAALDQGSADLFCKRPAGRYFWLWGSTQSYSTLPLECAGHMGNTNERAWLCSGNTLFRDIEIWILCNFHMLKGIVLLIFFNHLKIQQPFLTCKPQKAEW